MLIILFFSIQLSTDKSVTAFPDDESLLFFWSGKIKGPKDSVSNKTSDSFFVVIFNLFSVDQIGDTKKLIEAGENCFW